MNAHMMTRSDSHPIRLPAPRDASWLPPDRPGAHIARSVRAATRL